MTEGRHTGIKSYRDLIVWQEAMVLAEVSYRLTAKLPKEETYGLSAQIRRSAVSIPSNIAEGYARETTGSYVQFLRTARGSLRELETQLILCQRVGMLDGTDVDAALEKCDSIGRMLHGLIRSLQAS